MKGGLLIGNPAPGGRRQAALGLSVAVLLAVLGAGADDAVAQGSDADLLGPVRTLYLAAVEEPSAVGRGLDELEVLRARARPEAGPWLEATLAAYEGALITLRAKHARWPPRKLQYLREGLAVLDATIAAHPEHAEARYLRLMSCYYLPSILGRSGSVREDFAALAHLLPGLRENYPDDLFRAIARFVLRNGELGPELRRPIERALVEADD